MFSSGGMGRWQCGQRERGWTMDSCWGMREMHTLRKLPKASPMRATRIEVRNGTDGSIELCVLEIL